MGLEEIKAKITAQIDREIAILEAEYQTRRSEIEQEFESKQQIFSKGLTEKIESIQRHFEQSMRILASSEEKKYSLLRESQRCQKLLDNTLNRLENISWVDLWGYIERNLKLLELKNKEFSLELAAQHVHYLKELTQELQAHFGEKVSVEVKNFRGGFRVVHGRVEYNFSFDYLLHEERQSILLLMRDEDGADYE